MYALKIWTLAGNLIQLQSTDNDRGEPAGMMTWNQRQRLSNTATVQTLNNNDWRYHRNFLLYTTENVLPNDNVSMSVGHLDHVLIVYSSTEHVTWKSLGPMCGWVGRILHPDSCTSVHVFLIQSASFIHLVCRCASLLTTSALSQSMTWFSSTAWSVMADVIKTWSRCPTDIETLSLGSTFSVVESKKFLRYWSYQLNESLQHMTDGLSSLLVF